MPVEGVELTAHVLNGEAAKSRIHGILICIYKLRYTLDEEKSHNTKYTNVFIERL